MTEIPEQNSGSRPASIPVKDRRQHVRQRVSSLSYVDLGENNGGIVLNVSEGGIRIQAAQGLEEGPVLIRLQLPGSRKRLEVRAKVVWVGPTRKEAGLRFVDLSEDALGQIRKWIAREESPEASAEEEDGESVAETAAPVRPSMGAPVPAEPVSTGVQNKIVDDELAFQNEFVAEHEAVVESKEVTDEVVVEEADEIADEIDAPVATQAAARGLPPERILEVEPTVVVPLVPMPAETAELPVSTFNGISGTHGAPSMGFSNPALGLSKTPTTTADAPLFVRPHRPAYVPDDDGWKSYRVKLQSGWFVAALILLLALISFVAGMAVRRGALNSVIGQTDEPAHPQSAPQPTTDTPQAAPSSTASTGDPAGAATKPLEIEIVDAIGKRWEIPAAPGANHSDASTSDRSAARESATPAENQASSASPNTSMPQSSRTDASSTAAGAEKGGASLTLTLPETPISASDSVAIRSGGMVPVPPATGQSAQGGRNLQIGQLTNLVEPIYPSEARQRGIEGTVKLHAVIGTDGKVRSLQPLSGPESLVQAAMTAVREWKYNPTTLNGKPIETQEDISFVFRLPK